MEWRIVSKIAALAVALPTTAVLLYWLLIRKDDDVEEEGSQMPSGKGSTLSRQTTIQISVPYKAVGAVIGPKGATIKRIQEESGARANFLDQDQEGDEDRSVLIRGDRESVQRAELMIRQVVADLDTEESEEVYVPSYCIGSIIGRGGEMIRNMSRSSGCKLFIDRDQDSKSKDALRTVKIAGPHKNIQIAKVLIEERVKEVENFRRKRAAKGDDAEKRREEQKEAEEREERVLTPPPPPPPQPPKVEGEQVKKEEEGGAEGLWDAGDQCSAQVPGSEPMRESMEVFVSAVEDAGRFWLQMVNGEALNLEALTESMTSFYTQPGSSEKYKLTEVKVGDVVASPFAVDNSWYRARVEGFVEGKVDLFYLDFGDTGLLPLESLRELKPDFLSLPVQAVECELANVKPTGEAWSEEASDAFEELTHCAEWVILQARTVAYTTVGQGAGRQRPRVQLVNTATTPPTDIAQTLVAQGHALWEDSADAAPPGDGSATASAAATATAVLPAAFDTVRPKLVPDPQPS